MLEFHQWKDTYITIGHAFYVLSNTFGWFVDFICIRCDLLPVSHPPLPRLNKIQLDLPPLKLAVKHL
ncbi:hypothetical protein [Chroococcidiopsis thermalis]|uniref:hypothetical protein n=1 Tax=Chroococcidiopsis thermalis TaxID=54299 RepID=UPI0015F0BEA1|nr:hypothetical protein [Chroococcidiopsis thermalis]